MNQATFQRCRLVSAAWRSARDPDESVRPSGHPLLRDRGAQYVLHPRGPRSWECGKRGPSRASFAIPKGAISGAFSSPSSGR